MGITKFIAHFSSAAQGFVQDIPHSDWLTGPMRGSVFVHGDPHPTNIVFDSSRRPIGLIDFELATVGSDLSNLISLVFTWGPLEPPEVTCWRDIRGLDAKSRIDQILTTWPGHAGGCSLIETAEEFMEWRKSWIRSLAETGNPGAQRFASDPGFQRRYDYALKTFSEAVRQVPSR